MSKRNQRLKIIFNLIFYIAPIFVTLDLAVDIAHKTTGMWSLFELAALYCAYWFVLISIKKEQGW